MKTEQLKPADYKILISEILKETDSPKELLTHYFRQYNEANPDFLNKLQKAANAVLSENWGFDITLPFRKPENDFEKEADQDFDKLFQIGYWIDELKEPENESTPPAKLDLANRLLILSYLQDNGNFPKPTPYIKKKDWTEFLSILLSEPESNFKKAEQSAARMKSGNNELTTKRAENYRERLLNIKAIFEMAEIKDIAPKISKRIKELESIING